MTVGIGFCKYFFFCYIQYETSSKSIDCSVPFLYISFLSLHIYGCNNLFISMFFLFVHFSLRIIFFRFLLCGDRLRCLLWVWLLADVCRCDGLRPHTSSILAPVPLSLQVGTHSFGHFRFGIKNWIWVRSEWFSIQCMSVSQFRESANGEGTVCFSVRTASRRRTSTPVS